MSQKRKWKEYKGETRTVKFPLCMKWRLLLWTHSSYGYDIHNYDISYTQDIGSQNSSIDGVGALQALFGRIVLFAGMTILQWVAPCSCVYGQHWSYLLGYAKEKGKALRRRCVELESIWGKIWPLFIADMDEIPKDREKILVAKKILGFSLAQRSYPQLNWLATEPHRSSSLSLPVGKKVGLQVNTIACKSLYLDSGDWTLTVVWKVHVDWAIFPDQSLH